MAPDNNPSFVYFNPDIVQKLDEQAECTEESYRRAIVLNSENAQAYHQLGELLAKRKCYDEARQCFARVLQIVPESAIAHTNLGLLLVTQGNLDSAEKMLRQAVSLDAGSIPCRVNLASFLALSAREEDQAEAKTLFLAVINEVPNHLEAWNNLGRLLFETGFVSAACTAFTAAASYHPNEAVAHINLANVLLHTENLEEAKKHFNMALNVESCLAEAHRGLAIIFQKQGEQEQANHHRNKGFLHQPVSTLEYRGRTEPIDVVVLNSAFDGNTPWHRLIDSSRFRINTVTVEYFDSRQPLPGCQLIFNAIGDADLCQLGLQVAKRLIESVHEQEHEHVAVMNHPDAILQSGRLSNAKRMAAIDGVITAHMFLAAKAELLLQDVEHMLSRQNMAFPLLLRAPGFNGGYYFVLVENMEQLKNSVVVMPGEHVYVMQFLNPNADDAMFRKYRVMSINGVLYPIHMAVSRNWKVHYFSSDMGKNAVFRDEEKAFLDDFSRYLGPQVTGALMQISQTLGMDYCGIDFGLDNKSGNVLFYEANSTMSINMPSHEKQWEYRNHALKTALIAAKEMFINRAAG